MDVDVLDGDGWTALGRAAMLGQVAALEALVGMGASLNGGELPALFLAAATGQVAAAEALLSAGADAAATLHGETAAEWAAKMQQTAIVELLVRHSDKCCSDDAKIGVVQHATNFWVDSNHEPAINIGIKNSVSTSHTPLSTIVRF